MTNSKKETRRLILETAVKYFIKYGYEGTNLVQIGNELGITRGPLYYYFNNKKDLFLAAVSFQMEEALEELEYIYLQDEDILTKICKDLAYCASYQSIDCQADGRNIAEPNYAEISNNSARLYQLRKKSLKEAQDKKEIRAAANLNEIIELIYIYNYGIQGFNKEIRMSNMLDFSTSQDKLELFKKIFILCYLNNEN